MKLLSALALIMLISCSPGKNDSNAHLIKSAELKKDFQILRTTLEEAHPGLNWYSTKTQMDHYFDSSCSLLDKDMTAADFFRFLLPVIANVRCVHTSLRLPPGAAPPFKKVLPLNFYCAGDTVWISEYLTQAGIEGTELISADGIPAKDILHKILNGIPSDGYNISHKYAVLNKGAFKEAYALFFGDKDSVRLKLRGPYGATRELTFETKNLKELPQNIPPDLPETSLEFLQHDSLALVTVNTFELSTAKFRDTISDIFKAIHERRSARLIIDLRANGGGNNDNVSLLFSFIASEPFRHLKATEVNTGQFSYKKYFKKSGGGSPGDAGPRGKKNVNSRYAGIAVTQPAVENNFSGKIVVLISGNTVSAASEFAAIVHQNKRAIIVGDESGGCYYGATGGSYIDLVLPASGFELHIPLVRIFTAVANDPAGQPAGRGTLPNVMTIPTINDVIEKRDAVKEKALLLLQNKKIAGRCPRS